MALSPEFDFSDLPTDARVKKISQEEACRLLADARKRLAIVEKKEIKVGDTEKYNKALGEITKRIKKLQEKAGQKGKGLASTIKGLLGPMGIPDP